MFPKLQKKENFGEQKSFLVIASGNRLFLLESKWVSDTNQLPVLSGFPVSSPPSPPKRAFDQLFPSCLLVCHCITFSHQQTFSTGGNRSRNDVALSLSVTYVCVHAQTRTCVCVWGGFPYVEFFGVIQRHCRSCSSLEAHGAT